MTTSPYSTLSIKQGSTFEKSIPATVAQDLGFTDLVGVTVTSSIVTVDSMEHKLTVVIPDATQLTFNVSANTTGWKVGEANWDIKFTRPDGRVAYSPTVPVRIAKRFTT